MSEEVKATETTEAKPASEPVVKAKKPSIIPSFLLGFSGLVTVGVVAVFSIVGIRFLQGHREMNMPPEIVAQLAPQIVDPAVTAQKLEEQGFYKAKMGGVFLDGCRKEVLTDEFNKNLSNEVLASKIDTCIRRELTVLGARATMPIRRYY